MRELKEIRFFKGCADSIGDGDPVLGFFVFLGITMDQRATHGEFVIHA